MFWPEHGEARSQDLPEAYHDAGQFYWANAKKYLDKLAELAEAKISLVSVGAERGQIIKL